MLHLVIFQNNVSNLFPEAVVRHALPPAPMQIVHGMRLIVLENLLAVVLSVINLVVMSIILTVLTLCIMGRMETDARLHIITEQRERNVGMFLNNVLIGF
jgi:hypothetical protein